MSQLKNKNNDPWKILIFSTPEFYLNSANNNGNILNKSNSMARAVRVEINLPGVIHFLHNFL